MRPTTIPSFISVIISVYNGSAYIVETIESIQKSTYKNFEIILLNDGSTDASANVCAKLAKKYSNIRFYSSKKNKGLSNQLNFGLKKAKGKYICRINQDDIMLPSRLKLQVEYLEKHPKVVVVGSYLTLFTNSGQKEIVRYETYDKEIKAIWYLVSPFADPAVMYRRDSALQAGGYLQKFWPADDLHLWYRMGQLGEFANLPEPLTEMRWHKKAASQTFFRRQIMSTYNAHKWANSHIRKASIQIHIYWLVQLISGVICGPTLIWYCYKQIKKIIYFAVALLRKTRIPRLVAKVSTIPSKLSISGLYNK